MEQNQKPHEGTPSPGPPFGSVRPPIDPRGAVPPPPVPPPWYGPIQPPQSKSQGGGGLGRFVGWSLTGIIISLLMVSLAINFWLGGFYVSVTSGPYEQTYREGSEQNRIVIIPINGIIDDGSSQFVHEALYALQSQLPAAVVLRVDSGGGFVGPCDRIHQMIKQFSQQTDVPVIASFGTMATSGGYYVAAGSRWILAEPTCTTGSIGVIGGTFTIERLLRKVGVTPEFLTATGSPEKDVANSHFRAWENRDRQTLQFSLDNAHDRFVQVVYEGRKEHLQSIENAMELAKGRVYTAQQAIELKLVDGQGYLHDAINKAKELAQIPESEQPRVTTIRPTVQLGVMNILGAQRSESGIWSSEQVRRTLLELNSSRLAYIY